MSKVPEEHEQCSLQRLVLRSGAARGYKLTFIYEFSFIVLLLSESY